MGHLGGDSRRGLLSRSHHANTRTQSTVGPDATISFQENLLVVARLPSKIPALAKTWAPVHTLRMYCTWGYVLLT